MGMKEKLEKAYQKGFNDGQVVANEYAEARGVIKGVAETWGIMEKMFEDIPGIGPKTREKILKQVQQYSRIEKEKIMREMMAAKTGGGL